MQKFTKIGAEYKKNRTAIFIAFANGDINDENIKNYINRKLKEQKKFNHLENLKIKLLNHDVKLLNEI